MARAPNPLAVQFSTQDILSRCQGVASCNLDLCTTDWQVAPYVPITCMIYLIE